MTLALIPQGILGGTSIFQTDKFFGKSMEVITEYFKTLEASLGFKIKTKEHIFIHEHSLQSSIEVAHKKIREIFGRVETSEELYIDPEEPEYKYLNITISPSNVSENDFDDLLDKFDELQDSFFDVTDQRFASKITFHFEVL